MVIKNTHTKKKSSDIPLPPDSNDPRAMALHYLELIDALAQDGRQESKRLRDVLLLTVAEYNDNKDKETAGNILRARLAGIEEAMALLIIGTTTKLRDKLMQESRRLGTKSKISKAVREAAESFGTLCDGLQKLLDAIEAQDEPGRAQAQQLISQATHRMQSVQTALGSLPG
ncbi:MAG: hypothetical protein A2289_24470 [Deltaproteobacteria bacterium RIFOXYA12_FULL_58_15]|nr:MAG: hypothetical protein A2289_24470 [Deltaproteobacteria bacterium RIFOXYA12_FULL_58_15]OGR12316.1 MAG: hypothetical protein A2341_26835 [Deltaproteobacteria bacterium RIFOXYB12_FULL_58_9]